MKIATFLISATCMSLVNAYASQIDDYAIYCTESGGVVEEMPVEINTSAGLVHGQSKMFCNFHFTNSFVAIGLETFSAAEPSIAATFIKKMEDITEASALWRGMYSNPSHNVCKNIGGATIGFVASGGFSNSLGQTDICVFGDGSMVSGWSLIYLANHREGYDEIRNKVKAEPLNIYIPR